ncbi:helix-turn-helix domain-containing protein [Chelatococcus asaccharovorans]|uniref:helix-turn-helix domain-containing protein n=1 Tax=Chelatococcus asaccharovorans TaxID=28210 RepID=UPI00224C6390|nr:AraC family transcriptional regulator [Chelatococcus asaccharovorans]CAH1672319.1 Helix-turn-helix-domain containing protein AraC type [Chelatococcus asaccharovorans]CAH1676260.1 Helix-turn-helix-domain containing protein AraC type [Chelatococcus asaccharovorans]
MRGFDTTVLVRAKGFGALPEMIERRASETVLATIFARERLPIALRDAPGTPMPLRSMMGLFARGAAALDCRSFGFDVGEDMTHRGYGLWIEYAAAATTLGEGLHRAIATSWAHQSGARLELVRDGDHHVLRFATPDLGVNKIQYCDHLLSPMLTFIRFYLGARWTPDWAEVEYARDFEANVVENRLQVELRCGRPGSGLALKAGELTSRRTARSTDMIRTVTLRDVLADVVLSEAPEPARAISAVVALRLLDGQSDIDGAAHLVGLGVQALQRRLREKGFTYREIVEEARRARAIRLLIETQMSILAISLSLGYDTHASFTRAFIRWMGCTPSAYRRASSTPKTDCERTTVRYG